MGRKTEDGAVERVEERQSSVEKRSAGECCKRTEVVRNKP